MSVAQEAATAWWQHHFPNQESVQCPQFVAELVNTPEAGSIGREVLDRVTEHVISKGKDRVRCTDFVAFLSLFGPLEGSLTRCRQNLFDPSGMLHSWFHGAATDQQCSQLLQDRKSPPGGFLLRFSNDITCLTMHIVPPSGPPYRSRVSKDPTRHEYYMSNGHDNSEYCRCETLPQLISRLTAESLISTPVGKPKGTTPYLVFSSFDSENSTETERQRLAAEAKRQEALLTQQYIQIGQRVVQVIQEINKRQTWMKAACEKLGQNKHNPLMDQVNQHLTQYSNFYNQLKEQEVQLSLNERITQLSRLQQHVDHLLKQQAPYFQEVEEEVKNRAQQPEQKNRSNGTNRYLFSD